MRDISSTEMDGYVDKHISGICGCAFHNDGDNHCAHFVCHVMQYNFGLTCSAMSGKGEFSNSANIRVHEVFSRCRRVGTWADKPSEITKGFIFVTKSSNVNVTKKRWQMCQKNISEFLSERMFGSIKTDSNTLSNKLPKIFINITLAQVMGFSLANFRCKLSNFKN